MSGPDPHEMAERHSRMLAELAEVNLSAAKILHDRLVTAETNAEARDLGLALQRVSRSLRQTLLLEAKLGRDAAAVAREGAQAAAAEAQAAATRLTEARRAKVAHEVTRAVMEHAESAEQAEALLDEMRLCVNAYVHGHDWEGRTLDELVCDFCHDLGIAAAWEAAGDAAAEGGAPAAGEADFEAAPAAQAPAQAPGPPAPRGPFDGGVQAPHGGWAPAPDSS
jgi:hypothetical protein